MEYGSSTPWAGCCTDANGQAREKEWERLANAFGEMRDAFAMFVSCVAPPQNGDVYGMREGQNDRLEDFLPSLSQPSHEIMGRLCHKKEGY